MRNLVFLAAAGSVIDQANPNEIGLAITVAVSVTIASLVILFPLLTAALRGRVGKGTPASRGRLVDRAHGDDHGCDYDHPQSAAVDPGDQERVLTQQIAPLQPSHRSR